MKRSDAIKKYNSIEEYNASKESLTYPCISCIKENGKISEIFLKKIN